MSLPIFQTDRLIIRPFTLSDVEPSHQMNIDPEITKYTGDGGVVDINETRRRIKEDVLGDYKKYGFGRMAVEWKENGEFIGFTGLKYLEDLKLVDIGYRFKKNYWDKGIATESSKLLIDYGFDTLNLSKIIGLVLPANQKSIRVLKKLGLTYESEIIEDGVKAYMYSILKTEHI